MTYYIGFHQNESPFSKFLIVATSKSKPMAKFIMVQYNKAAVELGRECVYCFYPENKCTDFITEYLED